MTNKHGIVWKVIFVVAFVILVMFATSRVASQINLDQSSGAFPFITTIISLGALLTATKSRCG